MKFSLFPKSGKFFDLLREQSTKTMAAAKLLNEIFSGDANITDNGHAINQIKSEKGEKGSGGLLKKPRLTQRQDEMLRYRSA
jgi:hypothetical protein